MEKSTEFLTPVQTMNNFYALIYYHLAKEMLDKFGEEGEEALRRAVRNYAKERGEKLRDKHKKAGLEPSIPILFENYDLPGDPRTTDKVLLRTNARRNTEVYTCQYSDIWRSKEDGAYIGQIYCDEFHQAMWGEYRKDIKVDIPKILVKGDNICFFDIYLNQGE